MGAPIKEGLDWFKHDTDAATDEKVEVLRTLYGNDGYTFYFITLERAYRSCSGHVDVSDAETMQIHARRCAVTPQKLEEMIATAIKYKAFDKASFTSKGVLTSNGVQKRRKPVIDKRLKMKGKYSFCKVSGDVSDAERGEERPQSRVEKSRVENKKTMSPEALRLAGVLADGIIRNNSSNSSLLNGNRESTLARWAVDIDKLMRLNKQRSEDIERVIIWVQADGFWHQNILSGKSLRAKFDRLLLGANENKAGGKSDGTQFGQAGAPTYDTGGQ